MADGAVPPAVAAAPFLKWVGGKAGLLRAHGKLFPPRAEVQRLGLPFCGGGAVAFHYAGLPMVLSDVIPHLMGAYVAVRDHVEELLDELAFIARRGYSRSNYETCVEMLNTAHAAPVARRAAWVFVVSRWGFNGLWRMNGSGEINTPFGKPSKPGTVPLLFDEAVLRACSKALGHATFAVLDFEEHVRRMEVRAGDFLYFDPPFVPASKTANFAGYGPKGFTAPAIGQEAPAPKPGPPTDQERLAVLLPELDRAGIRWALSNSDTPEARRLFCQPRPSWNVASVKRTGTISSKTDGREAVGEILVRNYV